jgi:hypothetical protein
LAHDKASHANYGTINVSQHGATTKKISSPAVAHALNGMIPLLTLWGPKGFSCTYKPVSGALYIKFCVAISSRFLLVSISEYCETAFLFIWDSFKHTEMIRLLEYVNGEVRPHEFKDRPNPPRFAILSHRWGAEEVTYEELLQVSSRNKKGYQKIKWCGEQAKADGYDYFWVDTCCIDKRNNTEYAEAINSMFRWYKAAQVCYAYLADVNGPHGVAFEKSVWFTRGWTLQELVASRIVQFYDGQLQYLGDKESLEHRLVDITKIHQDVLRDSTNLSNYSIAERMSWAANRTTERVEDRAYSMLVIFGIEDMPILYGQGETAFQRLQERIMQRSDDFSIFAWQGMEDYGPGILASKPDAFKDSGGIVRIRGDADYKLAKQMIEVDMRLKPSGPCTYVGLLPCMRQLDGSQFGILLRHFPGSKKYVRVADGDDENRWINPDQADEFLPTDRIFIYQDIEESDGTIEGIKYTQVPSMSFRISASSAVTSQQSSNVQWDKIRQTFTKPANAMPNQGIIGELELEDNKAGIKIVRVGFDKYSNPVVMIARSCGLETSVTCPYSPFMCSTNTFPGRRNENSKYVVQVCRITSLHFHRSACCKHHSQAVEAFSP